MAKRDDPFTPQVARGKRNKPYFSPVNSPLRSPAACAKTVGSPLVSGLAKAVSKSSSGLINNPESTPHRPDANLQKKRLTEAMLSPAVEASPKASPYVSKGGKSQNRRAAAIASLGLQAPSTMAPPSAINGPKLTVEQMNKTFEEWMRIAADNVANDFYLLENQCQEHVECGPD